MRREVAHYLHVVKTNPRPVRFLLGRALVVTGLSKHFLIEQSGGYKLRFFPSNLSEQLWSNPTLREEPLAFFRAYLRPGEVVVDVGANIGDTSIVCAGSVNPGGMVYAFEPHPRVFAWLRENLDLNRVDNVRAANLALGESEGSVDFSDDRRDDMNHVLSAGAGTLRVPVKTLDSALPPLGEVRLLKVDVEGFELFVLRGARQVLQKTKAVHVEVGEAHFEHYGYRLADVLGILIESGFSLYRFASDRELVPIDAQFRPLKVENVVGARDPDDLRARISASGFAVASDHGRTPVER